MSLTLTYLLWSAALAFAYLMAQATAFRMQTGVEAANSTRDREPEPNLLTGRATRALRNFQETYPIFIALSIGIGAAISLTAARHGWAVIVNYAANRTAADAVVSQILSEGGEAVVAEGDVGSQDGIKAMFSVVDSHFGRIDGLVNNAGVVDMTARVDELSWERIERMFRINVTGSILCAAEAVRRMSTKHGGKGGAIVNISSVAASLGAPGQYVDYAASKGAIDTFTTGLAKEVATEGVRVNAVRPGIINTEIHASGGLPNRARDLNHVVPMQRPGEAQEIADAVLFLLSPSASYITGAFLDVSGGR